ncbi:MAG: AAA family ATPase [Pirellulales bacterium]|nr:AAA family ATPase [Pirellulales bacterium]
MSLLFLERLPRRLTKSELLRFLEEKAGLARSRIGRIELFGSQARVEIPDGWETRAVKAIDGAAFRDQRVYAWAGAASAAGDAEDHFERLGRLLELESRAEAERALERARKRSPEEAEKSGETLIRLAVADLEAGLGGRFLVQLARRDRSPLPWTRLGVGSPVLMSPETPAPAEGARGVVCERTEQSVCVAVNALPDELDQYESWRIDLSYDDVAVDRQRMALHRSATARGDRLAELREILLGRRQPSFRPGADEPPLDPDLNRVQRDAVALALAARDVAMIHGPPGTGKTTAVVELIRRAVRRGEKVLACAPSNLAVDNLLERLLKWGERAVRLGHPARVLPELREHSLDLLVEEHDDVRLAHRLIKQSQSLFRQADRYRRARPSRDERREIRQEAKSLLADARRLESQAVEHILDTADVLCATTTGLDSEILGNRRFGLAVIDEAGQTTEPGCWIPLLRCDRVVLAGDHCQLPPTVISAEAAEGGFTVSLFERLMAFYGKQVSRRLAVQYRMHHSIMDFSSEEFYEGDLIADDSVRTHRLADREGVQATPLTESPLDFIDTAGAGFEEEMEADGESRFNRGEADVVRGKVEALFSAGLSPNEIAVIAPYAAQVRWLRQQLDHPGLEIDSVDGFQGREKEAVVISLVRSNPAGAIGFLADIRRTNVAMTRARRKLIVIGDSATLAGHPFYRRMLEYFERVQAYRTVWEEGLV